MAKIVTTKAIQQTIQSSPKFAKAVCESMEKFNNNDWGISQDKELNDSDPMFAMGVYETPCEQDEDRIWIKSDDYRGHGGLRQVITVMFPSEY